MKTMMTQEQYKQSIRDLNLVVYMLGRKEENFADNPIVSPSLNALSMTYEMAHNPEYVDIVTAISHITGEKISRFNHIYQCIDDLIKKDRLNKLFNGNNGSSFHRAIGTNTLNALSLTTHEIDSKYGTDYHIRFQKYLEYVHNNDHTCNGSMADPYHGGYSPVHRLSNRNLLMHVVEKRSDGIIVRGAKVNEIDVLNSHEIIITPTAAFGESEKKYSVSFAVPTDNEEITYIVGRESYDTPKLGGNIIDRAKLVFRDYSVLCIFDNVFVPWRRVFMCEEHEFTQQMADLSRFTICFLDS